MRAKRAGAIFGLGDADHVLERHAHREMPRGFTQQLSGGIGARVRRNEGLEAVEMEPRIGEVLIRHKPPHAFDDDVARGIRHRREDFLLNVGQGRRAGLPALVRHRRPRHGTGARGLQPGAEAAQVGFRRLALAADRGLESLRCNRQPAAARDEAEHHGIDHRAALRRQLIHVEQQRALCMVADNFEDAFGIIAAVGHRHLFRYDIGARGRRDHQRAVGRDEAAGDGAAGLHQLAGDRDIDVADAGRQR